MKAQLLPSFLLAGAITVLIAQPAFAQVIEVTAVELNPTENGIEVILVTSAAKQLQILPRIDSNTYIADIPNTQLRLPSGNRFRRDNPTEGITAVTVTQAANSIRVTVTGSSGVPTVELFDSEEGLIFSFTPAAPNTQAQQSPPTPQTPEGVETENQIQTTQPSDESAQTLEQVQPGSEAQQGETSADEDEEIEIVVTGEQEGGYIAPNATIGTRTDTPLRDIPQSIQVVPQQVLEDQQVIRLTEALRNVSGVNTDDIFAGTIDRINIRGFQQDVFLRDNFRQSQFSLRETANLERIEVLKGPASVLYGNLEPGGVVNLVTKKPLSEPFYSAELLVGSYGFYQPNIDLSGSLDSDKTLLYRLNAVYESNDGFRDFDQNVERVFVAPVLTWQIGKNTDLTLEFDYLNDERPFDDGLVAIGTGVADVPRDRIFQNPDAVRTVEEFGAGYQLEHRFSENWTLRNAFRFLASEDFDFRLTSWIIEDSGQLDRRWRSNEDLYESYALQTNLVGEFKTGAINHTLLFGVDLNRETRVGGQRRLPGDPSFFLNIFTEEADPISKPDLSDLTLFARNENNRVDTLGIYLQDQIAFSDNLKLLLGGRFDLFDQRSIDLVSNTTFNQERQRFSPRIGLVYQPSEQISLYASYSQSFNPDIFSISADGSPLEPTTGNQYEVGIKGEFLDGRLSTTLAAYEISKENVATTDPNNTDFSIAVGEVRSRGIELDVVGEIADGWNIIASYAYTDAEIIEDNFFSVGNRLTNVPENSASLWTTYEIQSGGLQGLGFGAGLFFVGDRQGDLDNSFQLPSYVRTDAAIYYRRNNWRAALNFQNLFNVDYIRSAAGFRESIYPGEPFTVIGSVSVQF